MQMDVAGIRTKEKVTVAFTHLAREPPSARSLITTVNKISAPFPSTTYLRSISHAIPTL